MEPESESEHGYDHRPGYDVDPAEEVLEEEELLEGTFSYTRREAEAENAVALDDEALADSLASSMLRAGIEGESVLQAGRAIVGQTPLADVEADVERFGLQHRYCTEHGFPIPCLEGEHEPLPLDLTGVVGPVFNPTATYSREVASQLFAGLPQQVGRIARSSNLAYSEYSPDETRQFFGRRLVRFLTSRLGATRSTASSLGLDYGLRFRVFTRTNGLRIHYSPAYWFTPNQVFGSPTSPVDGWIMPGRYKFGAVGDLFELRFDEGEFRIPPAEEAHLNL